jgi:outer membrane receptor protein involved in Fe transport
MKLRRGPVTRHTIPSTIRAAILPAALLAAFAAQAQQAEAPIEKVEVLASPAAYDPRRDDTATKIVVQHDEIVKYGDTNVLDVMRRIPGVTVTGARGRGGEIRMRGLGSGYTQVLVNGERAAPGLSIDTLAPDVIERIEVMRAASAEFSTESIAGTINIVLRKVARKGARAFKTGYARGKDTHSPDANLELSDRWDRFSYSVSANAMRNNFNGEVPSAEEERDPIGQPRALRSTAAHEDGTFRSFNLVPRLSWTLDGGDTLSSESAVNINRMAIGGHAPTTSTLGGLALYPDRDIAMSGHRAFFQTGLAWVHKLGTGAKLDLKLRASAQNATDTAYRNERGNPAADAMTRVIDSHGTNRGLSSTGKYTVPLWDDQAFAIGWDGRYDKHAEARRERDYLRPSQAIPGGDEDATGNVARLALYAQDEWKVTPRWSLYLGGRWEGVRIHADANTFGAAGLRSAVFSPVMQTLYNLPGKNEDQLRLAVTRTYKAPGLQGLLSHNISVNNSQVEPDVLANPNLKPELALGVDAAYEHSWAEGAMVALSASSRNIDDYTRYLVSFDGTHWVSRAMNVGRARTHSLELETKFPLRSVFAAAPALDVRANVARNWSQVDSVPGPDNRLDEQTPLSANLGLDYSAGALTVGGSLAFKNGGSVRVSANQTAYVNVQRNLDLYASWKLSPQYQLRLSASNVLGQDIIRESSYTSATGVLWNRLVNVANASLRAALEAKF